MVDTRAYIPTLISLRYQMSAVVSINYSLLTSISDETKCNKNRCFVSLFPGGFFDTLSGLSDMATKKTAWPCPPGGFPLHRFTFNTPNHVNIATDGNNRTDWLPAVSSIIDVGACAAPDLRFLRPEFFSC